MNSEIISCPRCGKEIDLNYQDDQVVSQQHCCNKVKPIDGMKPLDHAMKQLDNVFKKRIKNEKFVSKD